MNLRPVRIALLLGVAFCATAIAVRAQDIGEPGEPVPEKVPLDVQPTPGPVAPGGPVAPHGDHCDGHGHGPQYRTVPVEICVPETYTVKRTVHRRVCKKEYYTAYKCICVPVQKTKQVTCHVRKPVWKEVCKTVTERVPCWETRTVMKPCWETRQVVEWRTRRVDRGCWEYVCEVDRFRTFCNNLGHRMRGGLFSRHRRGCSDPCDPCAQGRCEPCPPPPAMRQVKRWRSNWVCERYPVNVCKRVCVMKPVTERVCTYKCVTRQVKCRVCEYVCVPEVRTVCYTCYETKRVPYQACRIVSHCVPCEIDVTCCRMVRKTVYRRVAVCPPACQTACCPPACCEPCCVDRRRGHGRNGGGLLSGLFNRGSRHSSACCDTGCGFGGCH